MKISRTTLKQALAAPVAIALLLAMGACTPAEDEAIEPAAGETPASAATNAATAISAEPSESTPAKTEAAALPAASPSITGMVTFEGERPSRALLDTKADPKCHALHSEEPLLSQTEVIGENGEVAHAFIYVSNPPAGDYAPPAEPFVLDQIGCTYVPHVFGVIAGQELSIHNSDDTLHNVRTFARKNQPRNLGQPAGTKPRSIIYKKEEEEIKVKCDVHPWMTAYMFVLEHPFFAVTGEDGTFTIGGLPEGEYNVTAWHETYDEQEGTATVTADGAATLDFTFSR
jgi:hypothetical protein